MAVSRLCVAVSACAVVTISLTGCGSDASEETCNDVTSERNLFDGEWKAIGSSSGHQEMDVTSGWTTGGKPTSSFWGTAETAMSAGFKFFGVPVSTDVATDVIEAAQDFFDPEIKGKEGTTVYKQTFVQAGTVWQWSYHNGDVCGGTSLKTMNFMLTPMAESSYAPCCLPNNFASTDVHGPCTPDTPVSDPKCTDPTPPSPGPPSPPPATAVCVKNSTKNACGICATESDCGGSGSRDCDGGACCQLSYICTHCTAPNNCYHADWKVPCSSAANQKVCEDGGGVWEGGATDLAEASQTEFQSSSDKLEHFVA